MSKNCQEEIRSSVLKALLNRHLNENGNSATRMFIEQLKFDYNWDVQFVC